MKAEVEAKEVELKNCIGEKADLMEELKKCTQENADLSTAKQSSEAEVARLKEQLEEAEAKAQKSVEEGFSKGWDLALRLVLHRDPTFPWLDVEALLEKDGDEVAHPSDKELKIIAELDRRDAAVGEAAQDAVSSAVQGHDLPAAEQG